MCGRYGDKQLAHGINPKQAKKAGAAAEEIVEAFAIAKFAKSATAMADAGF